MFHSDMTKDHIKGLLVCGRRRVQNANETNQCNIRLCRASDNGLLFAFDLGLHLVFWTCLHSPASLIHGKFAQLGLQFLNDYENIAKVALLVM